MFLEHWIKLRVVKTIQSHAINNTFRTWFFKYRKFSVVCMQIYSRKSFLLYDEYINLFKIKSIFKLSLFCQRELCAVEQLFQASVKTNILLKFVNVDISIFALCKEKLTLQFPWHLDSNKMYSMPIFKVQWLNSFQQSYCIMGMHVSILLGEKRFVP